MASVGGVADGGGGRRSGGGMAENHPMDENDAADPRENGEAAAAQRAIAHAASLRRRSVRRRWLVLGFIVGAGLGAVTVLAVVVHRQLPLLKRADFDAAKSRWKAHGPASYDLDIEGSFDMGKGLTHVEVRQGKVTALTMGGQPKPQAQWPFYSVPGLFRIIADDLEQNEAAVKTPGGDSEPLYDQQAEFDPRLGYPLRYRRTVVKSGQTGEWKIIKFQPVAAD